MTLRTATVGVIVTGALVGTGLFARPISLRAAESQTAATPSAHRHKGEHHPEIHKAIKKLEAAKDDLQHAAHDFGGHRVKAIQAVDQALQELHLALESDKQ